MNTDRYRIAPDSKLDLTAWDPDDKHLFDGDKQAGEAALPALSKRLEALQELLYAEGKHKVLIVLQGMDTAGKDGTIRHVMSGVNPQGCQVSAFKAPSAEELDHDYLWRCVRHLPERGRIGIFNRSYYEETLVVRVHPEILAAQKLPGDCVTKHIWRERFQDIRSFERHLTRNGTIIRKFFLHVSPEEQKKRFLERIDNPEKNWKFSLQDAKERQHWDEYMKAYEEAIRETATPESPWYIVPADNKWYTRAVVAGAVVDALASLDLKYPVVTSAQRKALEEARRTLV